MFEVKSGVVKRPFSVLLYGVPGIGKTLFASQCGKALVCDAENGSAFLDVERIQVDDFAALLKAMTWVTTTEYETFVLDSVSAIERMVIEHTCASNGWKTLEDPGYGKGFTVMRSNWQRVMAGVEFVKSKGKSVVLIGHSKVRPVADPGLDSYDRFEFDADKNVIPQLVFQLDAVFFLRDQRRVIEDEDKKRSSARSTGKRELVLSDTATSLGKNRFDHMPTHVEFDKVPTQEEAKTAYRAFWKQVKQEAEPKPETEKARARNV